MAECANLARNNCLVAVQSRLPISLSVKQRNSIDRYGFSNWVSRKLHKAYVPRSFCCWIHGWIWWDPRGIEDFCFQRESNTIPKLVSTSRLVEAAKAHGVNNVAAAGLPYSYIFKHSQRVEGIERISGSALFVLDHSSEGVTVDHNVTEYLDYVDSIRKEFSCISILLYELDFARLAPIVVSYGFLPLIGASPRCPNSMQRIKALFDMHEFVSTNFIGSHVLYALASGCRVSIAGPYADRDPIVHSDEVSRGLYSYDYAEYMCYISSLSFLKASRLSFLLFDNPLRAPASTQPISSFVAEELGFADMRSLEDLPLLLGWDFKSQVNGYVRGGVRRARRLIPNSDY